MTGSMRVVRVLLLIVLVSNSLADIQFARSKAAEKSEEPSTTSTAPVVDERTIRQQNLGRGDGPIKFGDTSAEQFQDSPDSQVVRLEPENFDRLVSTGKWFVVFYAPWSPFDKRILPILEDLAEELESDGIRVGKFNVDFASKQFLTLWDIRGFPTIEVFVNGEFYKYDQTAERSVEAFAEFSRNGFSSSLSMGMFGYDEVKLGKVREGKEFTPITMLNAKNFDTRTSYGEWLVLFTAPWCDICPTIEETLAEVAEELKGKIKVGKIDGAKHDESSSRYRIKGFPVIVRITENGDLYYKYTSTERTTEKLVPWTLTGFKSDQVGDVPLPSTRKSDVIDLNDFNIDEVTGFKNGSNGVWMIEFYAPWCGHCNELRELWEEVATDLKGDVNVGKVDGSVNLISAKRFRIEGYPTILLFVDGFFRLYDGPRRLSVFTSFASGNYRQIRQKYPVPDAPIIQGVEPHGKPVQPSRFIRLLDAIKSDFKKRPEIIFSVGSVLGVLSLLLYSRCGFSRFRNTKQRKSNFASNHPQHLKKN